MVREARGFIGPLSRASHAHPAAGDERYHRPKFPRGIVPAIVRPGTRVPLHPGRAPAIPPAPSAPGGSRSPRRGPVDRGSTRVPAAGPGGPAERDPGRGFGRGHAVVEPHGVDPVFAGGPPARIVEQHRAPRGGDGRGQRACGGGDLAGDPPVGDRQPGRGEGVRAFVADRDQPDGEAREPAQPVVGVFEPGRYPEACGAVAEDHDVFRAYAGR